MFHVCFEILCVKLFVVLVCNEISRYKQMRYRGFRLDVLVFDGPKSNLN